MAAKRTIYLDFLDFKTAASSQVNSDEILKDTRLRYEILAFYDSKFAVAAPAIAKCPDTAFLLTAYRELWQRGRLLYVLSPKYNGDFNTYVYERKNKLEAALPEERLLAHFEYIGYTSRHWKLFFDNLDTNTSRYCLNRQQDADRQFRSTVRHQFTKDDRFLRDFYETAFVSVDQVSRVVEDMSNDSSTLFQREVIIEQIYDYVRLNQLTEAIIKKALDSNFALANAQACSALLPGGIDLINGKRLEYFLSKVPFNGQVTCGLVIESLSPDSIVFLSEQVEWQHFINMLNIAYQSCLVAAENHQTKALLKLVDKRPKITIAKSKRIASIVLAYLISKVIPFIYPVREEIEKIVGSVLTDLPSDAFDSVKKIVFSDLTLSIEDMISKLAYFRNNDDYKSLIAAVELFKK